MLYSINESCLELPSRISVFLSLFQEIYCNLGLTLSSGNLDSDGYLDLLVGSPYAPSGGEQRGFVVAFHSGSLSDLIPSITESDADWRHNGEQVRAQRSSFSF